MSLGGVDWRMAQPMQAQSAAPDWRRTMQAAVAGMPMGGAGMPMGGGGSNAPFDPATLPGMLQQVQKQQASKAGKPKPSAAPKLAPKPAAAAPRQGAPPVINKVTNPKVQMLRPDGSMIDLYGNVWDPMGNLLGPPGP